MFEYVHEDSPVQLKLTVSVVLGSVMVALSQDKNPLQLKLAEYVLGIVMVECWQEYWPLQLKDSLPRPLAMVEYRQE